MITTVLTLSLALATTQLFGAPDPDADPVQGINPEQGIAPDARIVPESQAEVQLSFAPVVGEAAPAVVNVYSRRLAQQTRDPFFNRFFGRGNGEQNSLGSGVIVDSSGVIVTNNHVVQNADELRVVLADRREYEAEILLTEERYDLAVLKVNAEEPLPVLPWDREGDAEVGDLVLAIGNPFGVGQTVTSGIVSALARTDVGSADYAAFIQTDAAINPGNSGGALVDMDGELIGVNTLIFSRSGGSNGIGFAIPVELVRRVVDAALDEGELIRPWLGARLQPVNRDLAEAFGLDRPRGALINEIYPGAAADLAGLQQGDVVLAIDGREVNDEPGARFRLATRAAGEAADFTVWREGEEVALDVLILPPPGVIDPQPVRIEGDNPLAGAELIQLSPAFNESIGLDPFEDGVVVYRVERRTAANYFGFQPGDRLNELLGERIYSVEQAEALLYGNDGLGEWPLAIVRRGQRYARTLRF
jgi:Do/DeqQ family serine protease